MAWTILDVSRRQMCKSAVWLYEYWVRWVENVIRMNKNCLPAKMEDQKNQRKNDLNEKGFKWDGIASW